jgi:hypothetical protein
LKPRPITVVEFLEDGKVVYRGTCTKEYHASYINSLRDKHGFPYLMPVKLTEFNWRKKQDFPFGAIYEPIWIGEWMV